MTGMEETMRNIQKDGAEVRLMRRGLDAGLAKALLVLEETKMKWVSASGGRDNVSLGNAFMIFANWKQLSANDYSFICKWGLN